MNRKRHSRNSPTYITRQSCGYCFRISVPPDVSKFVSKREIRYALRTGSREVAKRRAVPMASFARKVFMDIRKGGRVRELSEDDLHKLMQQYFRQTLEEDERSRVMEDAPLPREVLLEELQGHEYSEECLSDALASCNYESVIQPVERLLLANGIELDPQGYSFKKLCREMLKAQMGVLQVLKKRGMGDYSLNGHPTIIQPSPASQPAQPAPTPREDKGIKLSELIREYIEENVRAGSWTAKTKADIHASSMLLMGIIGDMPVKSITRRTTSEYKKALLRIPSNMRKKRAYRAKSLRQILAMDIPEKDRMSMTTVNKLIDRASMLFKWAVRNGHMDSNPAEGMMLKRDKRVDEERKVFSTDDLYKLFNSREYLADRHIGPHTFWVPILGLYTGCRIEEICQLHLDDIKQVDDTWCIDIIADAEDKQVKTEAAKRLVPLHPFLLNDLNFLQYVEHLKNKGHVRLFQNLSRLRDGYSHAVSQWFRKYRARCGVTDKGKVFHSFRHTFINTLKQNPQVTDENMIAELVGHEVSSITMGRYGKRYSPKVLFEQVIKNLSYAVDLSHLKESQFVRVYKQAAFARRVRRSK